MRLRVRGIRLGSVVRTVRYTNARTRALMAVCRRDARDAPTTRPEGRREIEVPLSPRAPRREIENHHVPVVTRRRNRSRRSFQEQARAPRGSIEWPRLRHAWARRTYRYRERRSIHRGSTAAHTARVRVAWRAWFFQIPAGRREGKGLASDTPIGFFDQLRRVRPRQGRPFGCFNFVLQRLCASLPAWRYRHRSASLCWLSS